MGPLVSVIIPAYNAEKYIADSIDSVLAQTYRNWEMIVVDDGSTDTTGQIAQQFSTKDYRIKYIFQENGRLGKARNTAINNANGSLIAFLDSDDLWLPEKLERQIEALFAVEADVVYSNATVFYEPSTSFGVTDFPIIGGRTDGAKMFDQLLEQNGIPVLSVLLRIESFRDAGPFEEALPYHGCEDYDLWLKLAARGAVFYGITDKLVSYRRHAGAMTNRESRVLEPMLRVVQRHIDRGSLSRYEKRSRVRRLYRDLIAALIDEGDLDRAHEVLNEFATWDKSGIVTSLQQVLIKITPSRFNVISRECLFRAEWHLSKVTRKLRSS